MTRSKPLGAVAALGFAALITLATLGADRGAGASIAAPVQEEAPTTAAPVAPAPPPTTPTTLGPVPEVPLADGWGANRTPLPGSVVLDMRADPVVAANTAKVVALTFDDGPSKYTAEVLDILARYKVKATFFMLSENAVDRPEDAKAVKSAGHHVAAHTVSHEDLTTLTPPEVYTEINQSVDTLNSIVGAGAVKCFRPPYGAYDDVVQKTAAHRGMGVMNWDIDTYDWKRPGADRIANTAISGAQKGSIILMHDGGGNRSQTVEALPRIIETLAGQGYTFVTVC